MKEQLEQLFEKDEFPKTAEILAAIESLDEVDIAHVIDILDNTKALKLFRLLPKDIAGEVFANLEVERKKDIIEALSDKEQAAVIDELYADDAKDFIEEMPPKVVEKLLKNASEETRQNINYLLKYPEYSAGSIMTVEYVRLKPTQTVKEAFDNIRAYGANKETVYTCYVVDSKMTLIGVVSVKDMLLASPEAKIGDIMTDDPIRARTKDDQEEVANLFKKYRFIAMPVVDSDEKLVGIITVDDILQVVEEEHTEDVSLMSSVTPAEHPYLKTSVIRHSRNRIIWLLFLMVSAMFTGGIISAFENRLASMIMLAAFIPMLMDTGGNAGAQSSTLVIRGMALGEVYPRDVLKVWWKEVRIALCCGVLLGIVNFVRILLFDGLIKGRGINGELANVALVVTLALCATVILAKSVGCLLPILAKKLKIDPAIMAAPLITTIVDAFSLLSYFGFAIMFNLI